jgi:hypothetical protein
VKLDNGLRAAQGCAPRPRRRTGRPRRGPAPRSGTAGGAGSAAGLRASRSRNSRTRRCSPPSAGGLVAAVTDGSVHSYARATFYTGLAAWAWDELAGGAKWRVARSEALAPSTSSSRSPPPSGHDDRSPSFAPAADLLPIRAQSSHATPPGRIAPLVRVDGDGREVRGPGRRRIDIVDEGVADQDVIMSSGRPLNRRLEQDLSGGGQRLVVEVAEDDPGALLARWPSSSRVAESRSVGHIDDGGGARPAAVDAEQR